VGFAGGNLSIDKADKQLLLFGKSDGHFLKSSNASYGCIVIKISSLKKFKVLTVGVFAAIAMGCTTVDPYTGQQRIDYGATAGVAGLALGATALGVALSNDDDRPNVTIINRRPVYNGGYRPYRPYKRLRRPYYRR
jgi:hypothetical protein